MAQGAKPGEGGQLPGFKVTGLIARLRHATPGVTLISPPPHHDIYSIEDLAQLIYDLKQVNPTAKVTVKLVAASGIGAVAAGVAKAKADTILVSGNVGGTGASPQTSIKQAGRPVGDRALRGAPGAHPEQPARPRHPADRRWGYAPGATLWSPRCWGPSEFGIGTASLIAMGCLMVRQCHSNTCPVGVCTQDEALRAKFSGSPEKVIALFSFIAEEVREILAKLGARTLQEIVGRTDLLQQVSRGPEHLDDLDLNPLLVRARPQRRAAGVSARAHRGAALAGRGHAARRPRPLFERGEKMQLTYAVRNTQRAIGARVSSHIVRRFGEDGLQAGRLTVRLRGSAGQSLGAFSVQGLRIELVGEANDYVGKGLCGATLVIRPSPHLLEPDPAGADRLHRALRGDLGPAVRRGAGGGALRRAQLGRAGGDRGLRRQRLRVHDRRRGGGAGRDRPQLRRGHDRGPGLGARRGGRRRRAAASTPTAWRPPPWSTARTPTACAPWSNSTPRRRARPPPPRS